MWKIITNYLDKRGKGRIENEIFHLYLDLIAEKGEYYKSQTSYFTRIIHRLKNKQDVVDWHIKRIEKYTKAKYIQLSDKQTEVLNQILEYKNREYDYELTEMIKNNKKLMDVSLGFSLRYSGLCLFEWGTIMIAFLLVIIIESIMG